MKNNGDSVEELSTETEGEDTIIDFSSEQADACRGSWLQGRYYSDDGETVRKFLSFNEVFDICPFERGVDRRAERRLHRELFTKLKDLLDIGGLMPRAFHSLSNGEMRRILFARAVLKRPKRLSLISPMDGLDPERRKIFASAMKNLRKEGFDISVISGGTSIKPAVIRPSEKKRIKKIFSKKNNPIVEMKNVTIRLGRRILFKNLSWTLREGERWLLKGPNGSGKTTLLSLITGDSPLGYANDIKVFGIPRDIGYDLSVVRGRIAAVSPEMQSYLDMTPEELIDDAFSKKPDLLLLDEPCFTLEKSKAEKIIKRIEKWLDDNPRTTAVCVAHCASHVPTGFDRILDLGKI